VAEEVSARAPNPEVPTPYDICLVSLESRIDDLYKLQPDEFVSARNALAKSLTGDEAKTVKALTKPTVVPWTVNQLYWHDRDVYTRLLKAGEKLREAQLTALKGKSSDVRSATNTHRQGVAEAVKAASELATAAGVHPDPDALARMFEALSVQKTPPEPHGRFTRTLQPQGFEALAGVDINAIPRSLREPAAKEAPHPAPSHKPTAAELREIRKREQEAEEAARKHAAAVKAAETRLSHAKTAEAKARVDWERSKTELDEAERALAELRNRRDR
jgi:hypothetical protein